MGLLGGRIAGRIDDDLYKTGTISQINEGDAAVVPDGIHPSVDNHCLPRPRGAKRPTVHGTLPLHLFTRRFCHVLVKPLICKSVARSYRTKTGVAARFPIIADTPPLGNPRDAKRNMSVCSGVQ